LAPNIIHYRSRRQQYANIVCVHCAKSKTRDRRSSNTRSRHIITVIAETPLDHHSVLTTVNLTSIFSATLKSINKVWSPRDICNRYAPPIGIRTIDSRQCLSRLLALDDVVVVLGGEAEICRRYWCISWRPVRPIERSTTRRNSHRRMCFRKRYHMVLAASLFESKQRWCDAEVKTMKSKTSYITHQIAPMRTSGRRLKRSTSIQYTFF
jgi:hypothetical protein